MRFEKINENKLKIELTKDDLIEHNLKLSDIAFGSENSRKLLHDIMAQAFEELEFDPDNLPLVIEAVPTSGFSINIFITKMKDQNEFEENLDKMSKQNENKKAGLDFLEKFATEIDKDIRDRIAEMDIDMDMNHPEIEKSENKRQNLREQNQNTPQHKGILEKTEIIYKFNELDEVIAVSHALGKTYSGKSILYKYNDEFYLLLNAKGYKKLDVVKLRLTLDEFGEFVSTHKVAQGFLSEHASVILKEDVLGKLQAVAY